MFNTDGAADLVYTIQELIRYQKSLGLESEIFRSFFFFFFFYFNEMLLLKLCSFLKVRIEILISVRLGLHVSRCRPCTGGLSCNIQRLQYVVFMRQEI